MKTKHLLLIILSLGIFASCEEGIDTIKKDVFTGYAQKGPFINGSSITISELDEDLNQTGRVYSTTISGNSGAFEQTEIELVSNYVQLKAEGYYFDEVSGELSFSQLTLYALADISEVNSANINVLTHLEKSRVEYLIKEQDMSFEEAKIQAQTDVLNIFSLELPANSTSESLNISASGEDNAILLAVSCILQGKLSTADMSELMADISADIRTDGTLDNASLGTELIDNANLINLETVRANLEDKYEGLGYTGITIPDFEAYVNQFKSNSTYTHEKIITYPTTGASGLNILSDTLTTVVYGQDYSMKAILPEGTSLKVVVKGGLWYYVALPEPLNWSASIYDENAQMQEFTVEESNVDNELTFIFGSLGTITVEFYENGAITPTKTKQITVVDESGDNPTVINEITYPDMGIDYFNEHNILNEYITSTAPGKVYSMAAYLPVGDTLKVILKGESLDSWIIVEDERYTVSWEVSEFDSINMSQQFRGYQTEVDMLITFPNTDMVTIEIYENDAITPTRIKYLNK